MVGEVLTGSFFIDKGFGKKQANKILDFNSEEGDSILVYKHIFGLDKKVKLKTVASKKTLKKASKTNNPCLLYTSPSPRDYAASRMPSSA